jgi:hypothetical protein
LFFHIKRGLGVSFQHQEREQRNSIKIPSPSRPSFVALSEVWPQYFPPSISIYTIPSLSPNISVYFERKHMNDALEEVVRGA